MGTPPALSELRKARRAQTLNHWLFLPILLALFLGANYIGWRHYYRADYSLNRFQELSSQSLNLLKGLPGEITMTAFLAPEGDSVGNLIQEDVLKLLEEYKYRSGGKIKLTVLQPFLDFQGAQKLAEKFKLTSNENVVILEYGERSRVLKVAEMAEIDPGMVMMGGAARVKSFNAEEKISSAISALVQGKPSKVAVAEGHGEYNLHSADRDPAGYSLLAARLGSQNLELVSWKPGEDEGVPSDADAVLVAGAKFPWPAGPIAKAEMLVETSDRYWAKAWPLGAGKKNDFVEGEDRKGPFTVAAVIDGSAPGDKGKEAPALRVVAIGSASAFANQNLSPLEVDFMVNALQWVLGRQEALGISPKAPMDFAVALDDRQQRTIVLAVFLGIPLLTAAAGVFVWWRRRH